MLKLDLRSRTPIYEQLVDKLKDMIINQVMHPDEQLPSVRELALELAINPNTIQKAFRELESQGYIYSLQGKGSFVMPRVNVDNSKRRMSLMQELKKMINELLFLGLGHDDLQEIMDSCIADFSTGKVRQQDPQKGDEQ